jgi:hypothetical protein
MTVKRLRELFGSFIIRPKDSDLEFDMNTVAENCDILVELLIQNYDQLFDEDDEDLKFGKKPSFGVVADTHFFLQKFPRVS